VKSKQINFFAVPEDLKAFEEHLKKDGIIFIRQPLMTDRIEIANTITERKDAKEWEKVYLTKKEFLPCIQLNFIHAQHYYLIEQMSSYVVEFHRPLPDPTNHTIDRSRFYFIKSYYAENGDIITKDKGFIDWADTLIKDFTKHFLVKTEIAGNDWYTRNTLEAIKEGKIADKLPLKAYFKYA
jgi:hypothetical protein